MAEGRLVRLGVVVLLLSTTCFATNIVHKDQFKENVCAYEDFGLEILNTVEECTPPRFQGVANLPRLEKLDDYVMDIANVLSKATIKNLQNITRLAYQNKSLDIVWLTIEYFPEGQKFKYFAQEVLEHVFSNETISEDDSARRKKIKSLKRRIKKAALISLIVEDNVIKFYTGSKFRGKIQTSLIRRAIRKSKKSIKNGKFDDGFEKLTKSLVKTMFRRKSFWETFRSLAVFIVPAIAFYFFMRKGTSMKQDETLWEKEGNVGIRMLVASPMSVAASTIVDGRGGRGGPMGLLNTFQNATKSRGLYEAKRRRYNARLHKLFDEGIKERGIQDLRDHLSSDDDK
eukprot:CAMPEP_0167741800 /NCGR_PEP_ID=MMETSP0110_2-20121227/1061_1 /TAXON_ID=629695 /ORGANISM="Gymnochlora sp., Strain CCMP2014" /LENGTH=342 /DNA_ID=CAMNT_0007625899 /DNA_START=1 /DNA_END=1030 /DNA_ORIENTATION=+